MTLNNCILTLLCSTLAIAARSQNTCEITDEECVFYFDVGFKLTMMDGKQRLYPANGHLYNHDAINSSSAVPVPLDDVISGDGWETPRLVTVVNGRLPGPDIIVYKGQTVVVHVTNSLHSESVSIHWHGLYQKNTPWMDGVPYLTQCPILPGQEFRYEFKAGIIGTYWWHSHSGIQMTMGVVGAFVVREREAIDIPEHILQIMEWNHDADTELMHANMRSGLGESSLSLDGSFFSMFPIHGGLINGRGRFHDPESGKSNMAPLTVFEVEPGRTFRFRAISTASMYPFRLSIDNHMLTVIASDGYELEPVTVESIVLQPAERFDFLITADQPVGNYWIRGVTLEKDNEHRADAILRYTGAPGTEPTSARMHCTMRRPCRVLNCPFRFFPEQFVYCFPFNNLRSAADVSPAPQCEHGEFREYFLNFGFPGKSFFTSINGRQYDTPDVNLMAQSSEWSSPCDVTECGEERTCKCTHTLNIGNNDTVQLVLTNMGSGRGWSHPIHIHGHSFHVIKTAFGHYDHVTAEIIADNEDIDCRGNPDRSETFCNDATWANSSWLNGNVPGTELLHPPRKDTITVPTGGYVVLRLLAHNPGLWAMHCHIEFHMLGGMMMALNESWAEIVPPPAGFPECRSFRGRDP